ncbi:hypothetical protein PHPALM_29605 [Phytophthora palmivora]|uniref:Uncharacterized protein n=1 Tax=Phytophthora palmivora TaxID=4796 RepID=A0A2P4X751_9STRA|nr:hypothetical protein PHPALM_29605 [Phytophthora palmivora]
MGIRLHMTTSYRVQIDGQTERQNLILKYAPTLYGIRDWSDHLGTKEYMHATLVSASTGFSPFEVDTRRKKCKPLNPLDNPKIYDRRPAWYRRNAKQFHDRPQEITEVVKQHLQDLVKLHNRRISSAHVTQDIDGKHATLAARKVGTFVIIKMINPNVAKLKLPRSMSCLNSMLTC